VIVFRLFRIQQSTPFEAIGRVRWSELGSEVLVDLDFRRWEDALNRGFASQYKNYRTRQASLRDYVIDCRSRSDCCYTLHAYLGDLRYYQSSGHTRRPLPKARLNPYRVDLRSPS